MSEVKRSSLSNTQTTHELIMDLEDETKHILNEKLADEWSICCSKSDRNALIWMIQVMFGAITVLFCMISICVNPEADNSVYFGLLGSTLGYFMPSPTLTKKNDD